MRRTLKIVAGITAATVVAAFLVGAWGYERIHRPYSGWSGEAVVVDLPRGLDGRRMLGLLQAAGVIENVRLARLWLKWTGEGDQLQAGEYRFESPASAARVIERLVAGDVLLHPLTIPEGLDLTQIADRFAASGWAERDELLTAFCDPSPIRKRDPDADDLEGYLYPDTYMMRRGMSAGEIVAMMVAAFEEATGEGYRARAEAQGLKLREAVILASLIEEETSLPDERPRISRVFHNRLSKGMKLQCDPTVLYGLRRAGQPVERLLYRHLEIPTPWNTYAIDGLPKGPICSPGRASLEAAVAPADGAELYFVAAPDGGHSFSRTLAEHERAVAVWRRHQRRLRTASN